MGGSIYLHLIPHHPKQFSVCSAPFEKAKSNDPSGFKFFQDDCDGITMLFKAFDSSSPKQIMLDHNIVHLPRDKVLFQSVTLPVIGFHQCFRLPCSIHSPVLTRWVEACVLRSLPDSVRKIRSLVSTFDACVLAFLCPSSNRTQSTRQLHAKNNDASV